MIEEMRQLQAYVESHASEMELRNCTHNHSQVIWRNPRQIILDVWPTTGTFRPYDAKNGVKGTKSYGQPTAWVNECARMRKKMLDGMPAAIKSDPERDKPDDLLADDLAEAVFLVSLHALIMRMETVDPHSVCRLARRITVAACES